MRIMRVELSGKVHLFALLCTVTGSSLIMTYNWRLGLGAFLLVIGIIDMIPIERRLK
jgi:hypothetical protein